MDALKVPFVRALSSATAFQDAVEACKVRGCSEVDGEARAGDGYGEFAASSWCDEFGVFPGGVAGSGLHK